MTARSPRLVGIAAIALLGLAACSGSGSAPFPIRAASPMRVPGVGDSKGAGYVYVSYDWSIVVLSSTTYQYIRTIPTTAPAANLWVDNQGDLYVSSGGHAFGQYKTGLVTEYGPGATHPKCIYSANTDNPLSIVTDTAGNVFLSNQGRPARHFTRRVGWIDEYSQCSNVVKQRWVLHGSPDGLALDSAGNMYVNYRWLSPGRFEEYAVGHTKPKIFRARINAAAGMAMDSNGNIIVPDQRLKTVDIIAPPYKTVQTFVSGLSHPVNVSLNASENLLFVADIGTKTVVVFQYPSGQLVTTLGSGNGIQGVQGVAVSPDAVF